MKENSQDPGNTWLLGEAREIAFDCKFFLGDRPCIWHKAIGVLCTCDHYQKVEQRLLIIKLDAMGDVLRTTALLPALADAHPCGSEGQDRNGAQPSGRVVGTGRPESDGCVQRLIWGKRVGDIAEVSQGGLSHLRQRIRLNRLAEFGDGGLDIFEF